MKSSRGFHRQPARKHFSMSPLPHTDTPILVPMRTAAAVRTFVEDILQPEGSWLLRRDPERGRVIAMTSPEVDLRVIPKADGALTGNLSLIALQRNRCQLVFRVPTAVTDGNLLIDLAQLVPGGALLASRHQMWRGRKSWWVVSQRQTSGYFFAMTHHGLVRRSDPPWIDARERQWGLAEAMAEFDAALKLSPPS